MGVYLNPKKGSKEKYLIDKGERLDGIPKWKDVPKGKIAICLVFNDRFSVAFVAYNEYEFNRCNVSDDNRPKIWYLLSKEDVMAASDWDGEGM